MSHSKWYHLRTFVYILYMCMCAKVCELLQCLMITNSHNHLKCARLYSNSFFGNVIQSVSWMAWDSKPVRCINTYTLDSFSMLLKRNVICVVWTKIYAHLFHTTQSIQCCQFPQNRLDILYVRIYVVKMVNWCVLSL